MVISPATTPGTALSRRRRTRRTRIYLLSKVFYERKEERKKKKRKQNILVRRPSVANRRYIILNDYPLYLGGQKEKGPDFGIISLFILLSCTRITYTKMVTYRYMYLRR